MALSESAFPAPANCEYSHTPKNKPAKAFTFAGPTTTTLWEMCTTVLQGCVVSA